MPLDVIAPRANTTQQVNHVRKRFQFSSAFLAAPALILGCIPVNSIITRVSVNVRTPFNAGTTNTLTVGVTSANANELVASGDVNVGAAGYTEVARGLGTALTQVASPTTVFNGVSTDQTEGGVGIFAKFAQTGTPATAGDVDVIITFLPALADG